MCISALFQFFSGLQRASRLQFGKPLESGLQNIKKSFTDFTLQTEQQLGQIFIPLPSTRAYVLQQVIPNSFFYHWQGSHYYLLPLSTQHIGRSFPPFKCTVPPETQCAKYGLSHMKEKIIIFTNVSQLKCATFCK